VNNNFNLGCKIKVFFIPKKEMGFQIVLSHCNFVKADICLFHLPGSGCGVVRPE